MTKYLLITYIPSRQGWLAPIPEKWVVEEAEAQDVEDLRLRTHVPLGGYVKVVEVDNVLTFKSRIVNEVHVS